MTITADAEKNSRKAAQETETAVLEFLRQRGIPAFQNRVIVACSGGADSMALLLFFLNRREQLQITLEAAHVNHGIRGGSADRDAAFVEQFCRARQIPFHLFDARKAGISIPEVPSEAWARTLRYNWFDRLAQERNALIATAHTLSDQTETMLLRLARGTGLHGAAGIPAFRAPYIRPFLCLTRQDTENYCRLFGQTWVEDESNGQDCYARNRLRHGAVPALKSVNPVAERSVGRFCTQMAELDEWVQGLAKALLAQASEEAPKVQNASDRWQRRVLLQASAPVRSRALQLLISPLRDAEEKYILLLEEVLQNGQGAVQITEKVRFVLRGEWLVREETTGRASLTAPTDEDNAQEKLLKMGETVFPGGFCVRAERIKYEEFLKNEGIFKKDSNCCADYARILKNARLRTRMPGDRYAPAGRDGHKTLKKLFNERRIPTEQREQLPLLAAGSEVFWLWGMGFAAGLAPDAETEWVLLLHSEQKEP